MPSEIAKLGQVFHKLDQKAVPLLAGAIPGNEFPIDSVLGCLSVLADRKSDRVRRTAAEIVAHKIHRKGGNSAVPEFTHSEAQCRRQQSWD